MASRVLPSDPFMPEPQNGNGRTMLIDGKEVEIIRETKKTIAVKYGNKTGLWDIKKKRLACGWRDQAAPHYRARTL